MLRVYNNTARYVDQGGNKVWMVFSSLLSKEPLLCRAMVIGSEEWLHSSKIDPSESEIQRDSED